MKRREGEKVRKCEGVKVRRSKGAKAERHEMKILRLALDDSNLNTRLWSIRFPFCFNAAFAALVSYLVC